MMARIQRRCPQPIRSRQKEQVFQTFPNKACCTRFTPCATSPRSPRASTFSLTTGSVFELRRLKRQSPILNPNPSISSMVITSGSNAARTLAAMEYVSFYSGNLPSFYDRKFESLPASTVDILRKRNKIRVSKTEDGIRDFTPK